MRAESVLVSQCDPSNQNHVSGGGIHSRPTGEEHRSRVFSATFELPELPQCSWMSREVGPFETPTASTWREKEIP